jgi:hypothetical protein
MCGLLGNTVVCGIVMKSVTSATKSSKSRAIALLSFGTTMGMSYIFAALALLTQEATGDDGGRKTVLSVFEVLLCLGMALQGVLVFYFHARCSFVIRMMCLMMLLDPTIAGERPAAFEAQHTCDPTTNLSWLRLLIGCFRTST